MTAAARRDPSQPSNPTQKIPIGNILSFLPQQCQGLNDRERQMWIDNDEALYNWKRSTRLSMREFIKQNREELDRIILAALNRPPRS